MKITIREPGSAITHYIAMMMAMIAAVPLVIKATMSQEVTHGSVIWSKHYISCSQSNR